MKRLILMRHAKSSWADPGQDDIDRPLNARGKRDARRIGRWLRKTGYLPKRALVSSSARTRETWAGVATEIGARPVEFLPELYHADPEATLRALRDASGAKVLLIGHQPGIGAFAHRLLAAPPDDAEFGRYPTAATAIIDFEIADWRKVDWNTGRLIDFVVPRALD